MNLIRFFTTGQHSVEIRQVLLLLEVSYYVKLVGNDGMLLLNIVSSGKKQYLDTGSKICHNNVF